MHPIVCQRQVERSGEQHHCACCGLPGRSQRPSSVHLGSTTCLHHLRASSASGNSNGLCFDGSKTLLPNPWLLASEGPKPPGCKHIASFGASSRSSGCLKWQHIVRCQIQHTQCVCIRVGQGSPSSGPRILPRLHSAQRRFNHALQTCFTRCLCAQQQATARCCCQQQLQE